MKKIILEQEFFEYPSWDSLPEEFVNLLNQAKGACENAYAPYSSFSVGAAVLLDNGEVVTGSNQENAAYPSGLCAERVALFAAHATYPKAKVLRLAVYASSDSLTPDSIVSPCGACRQVISEYEFLANGPIELIMAGQQKVLVVHGIDKLLPFRFSLPK